VLSPNDVPAEILLTDDAAAYLAAALGDGADSTPEPRQITETDCRDALSNLVRLSLASVSRNSDEVSLVRVHVLGLRAATDHLAPARRHALS
jgi:hypothetical protein